MAITDIIIPCQYDNSGVLVELMEHYGHGGNIMVDGQLGQNDPRNHYSSPIQIGTDTDWTYRGSPG